MEAFEAYFRRADLDQDGRISGEEAVAFLQLSNLPKHILAQIWMHADQNRTNYLGRPEFYNALRLVTVAQSGRELTPDMIKAALYGPAAAKIPAPKMNLVSTSVAQMNSATIPTPHSNNMVSSSQMGVMGPAAQNFGFRGQQALPNVAANNFMRPPTASLPIQGVSQGLLGGGSVAGPRLPSSNSPNLSTNWLGARTSVASVGLTSQAPIRGLTPSVNHDGFGLSQMGTAPRVTPNSQKPSVSVSSIPPRQPPLQPAANVSKALVSSGNGFFSDSIDGGDLFSATPQAKQDVSKPISNASNMPNSSSIPMVTAGSQSFVKPGQPDPLQSLSTLPPIGNQLQQTQPLVKQNQLYTTHTTSPLTASNVSVGHASSGSSQSQLPWPRISQSDIQKYTSVFFEVDKDRDGKITGEEARNLFLSWKLPREVLKQVWDLSDQDSDSMLSLREFCTALYLMERHREGRPLPSVLPNSLRFDETLLLATGQPSTAHTGPAWQPHPGLSQQGRPEPRPVMTATGVKPPMPTSLASQTDGTMQPLKQKSKVPVLEQHLVYQLSKEEQSSLNSKFQEAADADKKVQELEKEILDSREKIEFYRTKMQELVLYKSKCDNRLNEVMERVSADKHEVESLAKKYESKYKQTGDVASKLTAEEATFREIQENKLALFNAIVKMEQGGNVDGSLQVRADQIQSDLNDIIKALNERCKQYGLRAKPTSLIELPFGWQPGIQDGAAGWDEDWDSFEEEGFTVIKELTTEVENVVATAKPMPPSVESDKASKDEVSPVASSSDVDNKIEKLSKTSERIESESADAHSEDGSARSLPGSPGRSGLESSSQEFHSTQLGIHDISPHAKESHIDHSGAESTISGDKSADEPSWGATFDASDDADSVWGFNSLNVKETDRDSSDRNIFFGSGSFGLNPIRIDSPSAASSSGRRGPFFDSVPSTPQFNSGSPPRFNEGPEDRSFDDFGRFDSFSMHDGGLFPQRETLARFDSMRSEKLTRFDSISSTTNHNRGFPSFDDADPFGSSGPFKSSESPTPKRGTDHWSAF